jgi:hypothetical protein
MKGIGLALMSDNLHERFIAARMDAPVCSAKHDMPGGFVQLAADVEQKNEADRRVAGTLSGIGFGLIFAAAVVMSDCVCRDG